MTATALVRRLSRRRVPAAVAALAVAADAPPAAPRAAGSVRIGRSVAASRR